MGKKVIKLDLSDESGDEEDYVKSEKSEEMKIHIPEDYVVDAKDYYYKSWPERFISGKVKLLKLLKNNDWNEFFLTVKDKSYFMKIEQIIQEIIINEPDNIIVPYPRLLFHPLNILSPKKIRVVILGQDPYINSKDFGDTTVPQAMGVSFSAPINYPKPKSLINIYDNLKKFNHIKNIPDHGYLLPWVVQGCLMINTSLTTFLGTSNAHKSLWTTFSDELIKYINNNCKNVVFILWGQYAANKEKFISVKNHKIIISSHPSPYSVNNTMMTVVNGRNVMHKPFAHVDHFGITNDYLRSKGFDCINWDAVNNFE